MNENEWIESPNQLPGWDKLNIVLDSADKLGFWHVTRSCDAIQKEGLKARSETMIEGLGGGFGNHDSSTISVGWSYSGAIRLFNVFTFIEGIVSGTKSTLDCIDFLLEWFVCDSSALLEEPIPEDFYGEGIFFSDFSDSTTNQLNVADLANAFQYSTPNQIYEFFIRLNRLLQDRTSNRMENGITPRTFGIGVMTGYDQFRNIKQNDIAILQLQVRRVAQPIYHLMENEIRFYPADLRPVGIAFRGCQKRESAKGNNS